MQSVRKQCLQISLFYHHLLMIINCYVSCNHYVPGSKIVNTASCSDICCYPEKIAPSYDKACCEGNNNKFWWIPIPVSLTVIMFIFIIIICLWKTKKKNRIYPYSNNVHNYQQKKFRLLPSKNKVVLVRQKPSQQKYLKNEIFSKYINDKKVVDVPPAPKYHDLTLVLNIPVPVIAAPINLKMP